MIKKLEIVGVIIFGILFITILAKYITTKNSAAIENSMPGPGDITELYFNAMTIGDFKEASKYYDQIVETNEEALNKESYFYKTHWSFYGINIGDEEISENTARVKVTINKYNHIKIMANVKKRLLEASNNTTLLTEQINKLKNQYILEEYKSAKGEVVTNEYEISLVKNNDEWKIVNNNVIKDILFGSKSNISE